MAKHTDSGFLYAFGIFALSTLTYPFILVYSGLFLAADVGAVFLSPATLSILGILLVVDFLFIRRNYSTMAGFLRAPDDAKLDEVQKTLIEFPRRKIAMSLLFVLVSFQIILFFFPAFAALRLPSFLLAFANASLFGIPLYVLFYQRIEKWASPIPYTSKYVALKLSARIPLVVMFSILYERRHRQDFRKPEGVQDRLRKTTRGPRTSPSPLFPALPSW